MVEQKLVEQVVHTLMALGLTQYEAKAYTALLKNNPANAHEISRLSGVPAPKIYETMTRLTRKGMASLVDSDPTTYYPLPVEEFVKLKENEFIAKRDFLKLNKHLIQSGLFESPVWLIRSYSPCISKASEIIRSASREILISFWPEQGRDLQPALRDAHEAGVSVTSMQFSEPVLEIGKVYRHTQFPAVFTRHESELTIACDESSAFFMRQVPGRDWESYWTLNQGVTRMVISYIRHDIYINRAIQDFREPMEEKYGKDMELLIEI
ncbi:MAG: helix-turn-helix domain-containing protein [Actinomycetota bacterium]|nr:helix-turn-helix domain-containing protein [Actinomycetota bacterium]